MNIRQYRWKPTHDGYAGNKNQRIFLHQGCEEVVVKGVTPHKTYV